MNIFSVVLGMTGSISLFLYAVISFGKLIKENAGQKIKELLYSMTSNPVKGVFFGAISTAILQSSTATSVIVASLADAGVISFYHSIGIIFGVNIGTTITSQLIAFNIMSISPYIIILGVLLYFWGRGYKKYAKSIIYFGLLFYSIYLISIFALKIDNNVIGYILSFNQNILFIILIGIVSSVILQSSAVVTGLVLVFVGNGTISIIQAVGLILGANIGTTSTVLIASTAMGKDGKKVAFTHLLFNFVGVIIFLPVLKYFIIFVELIGGDIVHKVANIHLLFNLFCVFIFLLMIRPFSILINKIIK
ncbi:MAG: Na/Pi symporter [Candidatus Pacebacteria bacterium]|nr:Na/Pi symporter [Candidatus Paceibacterota bacterium]